MSAKPPHRPEKSFTLGNVQGAVWRHEHERDGKRVLNYSYRPQCNRYDRDTQKWSDSEGFFGFSDLLNLVAITIAAFIHMAIYKWWRTEELPALEPEAPAQPVAQNQNQPIWPGHKQP